MVVFINPLFAERFGTLTEFFRGRQDENINAYVEVKDEYNIG